MPHHPGPRLGPARRTLAFWAGACALAFVLAFGLGSVWADRRAAQEWDYPTYAAAP